MERSLTCKPGHDLAVTVRQLVEGCRTLAQDGTVLYTPDGIASYDALWLRDFSYMAEYAPECIPNDDLIGCIRFAGKHQREDGWMPDRTYADGTTCYAAGMLIAPVGKATVLDLYDSLVVWPFADRGVCFVFCTVGTGYRARSCVDPACRERSCV